MMQAIILVGGIAATLTFSSGGTTYSMETSTMHLPQPAREEIDHHTIKLLVGLIAISLGSVTSYFAYLDTGQYITSISEAYHVGRWAQSFFVGFLFAISAFLLAYNGLTRREMILSKAGSIATICVALFPCECGREVQTIRYVHAAAATVMFLILAGLCYIFYQRARSKGYMQARVRAAIYSVCGTGILLSILVVALDRVSGNAASLAITQFGFNGARLTYYAEHAGLVAFGISWLTASRTLPLISK
jgi:hypothetical protein